MRPESRNLRIPVEKHRLANGLRLLLSPQPGAPVATIYLIYRVGARAEPPGRSGFAHLFEHMMFQGSENAPKGLHFRLVESNGGTLNGSTHPDYTDYFEVLPSNKLALGLWLEADRMRGLAITEENLANQKEAVKQERRLSFDNQPYNTALVEHWPRLAFRNWANAHSLIGSYEDLEAATVADVEAFFRTYYAPNNAVLAIAGAFDPAEALRLVEEYFGDIPQQPQPPQPDLAEPEQTEPRREVYYDRLARVPAVVIGYPGPPRRSPDYYALTMLDIVLTGGESSRFYQNLVKGRCSVIQYEANLGWPFAGPTDYLDPGRYAMFMLHHPEFTGDQIRAQVEEEIARIQNDGVPETELERARAFLRSGRLRQLESSRARAMLLGQYELFDGDPELLNRELEILCEVSARQIQQAAQRYLVRRGQCVLEIVPVGAEPDRGGEPT
ncbi:MAG: pitrilysin family protein [Bryobacterales bacterium]|nr:insulinase family protein [Bryobacteraceae bacterium]MDW8129365.1 pitrilysin family protein [Bryobacterales bacterium]